MLAFISSIGAFELLIIGVILLIFVGPKRLPQLAQTVGKGMREFKSTANDIQREVYRAKDELINLAQDGIEDELDEMGLRQGKEEKVSGGLGVSSRPPEGPIKNRARDQRPEGTVPGSKAVPTLPPQSKDEDPSQNHEAGQDITPPSSDQEDPPA